MILENDATIKKIKYYQRQQEVTSQKMKEMDKSSESIFNLQK